MALQKTSRRNFLKGVLAASGAVAATFAPQPACARDTLQRPPEGLGLLYDATLCVGCQACVAACKQANNNPAEFNAMEIIVGYPARYDRPHFQPDQDVPQWHDGAEG